MCCICVCLFVHLCVFYLRVCVCVECSFLHSVPAPPIAFLMASIHVQITNGLLLLDSCYVSNNSFNVTLFRFFFLHPLHVSWNSTCVSLKLDLDHFCFCKMKRWRHHTVFLSLLCVSILPSKFEVVQFLCPLPYSCSSGTHESAKTLISIHTNAFIIVCKLYEQ